MGSEIDKIEIVIDNKKHRKQSFQIDNYNENKNIQKIDKSTNYYSQDDEIQLIQNGIIDYEMARFLGTV